MRASWATRWKQGEVIRNRKTNTPMLVLHVFIKVCTLVMDLTSKDGLAVPQVIMPKDYSDWGTDQEFESEETKEDCTLAYAPERMIL